MAVLAGVELETVSPAQRQRIRAQQRKERRLDIAAERYAALERRSLCEHARRLRLLDRLEILAGSCLQDALRSSFDSAEFWWEALACLYSERWKAIAEWLLVAFGSEDARQRFVLYPGERPSLVVDVLNAGGVVDDRGHWRELAI